MLNLGYTAARRVVIAVVGGTVVAIGVAMLVLPGPALLVIPAAFQDVLWGVLPMVAFAAQMLALFIGFPWALATEGKTLSDLLTKTRVCVWQIG